MKNLYSSLGVFASLFYLVVSFFLVENKLFDYIFAGLMLVLLGIPHGAVDHLVAERLAKQKNESFTLAPFIMKYLGIMFAYGVCWQFFPQLSFILFIGISIFHFGDIESTKTYSPIQSTGKYILQIVRSSLLGLGILGFILTSHREEVNAILVNLPMGSSYRLGTISTYYFLGMMLLGFQKEHASYFINTLVTLLMGKYIPLIPAFVCYFGACHAMYSLRILSDSLQMTFGQLYLKLLPLTLVAIILGIAYVSLVNSEKWLAHAFIFLSILTLPHFFLMHQIAHKTQG
jgi:Brp/Blh family beta-carotene 15,15'-monooxygenase